MPEPRRWSDEELEEARLLAVADFVAGRNDEGGESYASFLAESIAAVERLLTATDDLLALGAGEVLTTDGSLVHPLRFTAGPFISEDDLAVMADVRKSPRAYRADEAERLVILLSAARDPERFPWLAANPPRPPDVIERRAAILSTAALWAGQRMATKRRTESSGQQEAAVRAEIAAVGFTEVERRRYINNIDDLERGQFCAEAEVAGVKADICVRLHNGRLLLIECKVSNSATNSVKRVIHDVGDKVAVWQRGFGAQAIPMAVISGVFRLKNLRDAQAKGIAIVWQRDLSPLLEFLAAAV
jgi:hypothetical protein